MNSSSATMVEQVKEVVVETLGIDEARAGTFDGETRLFGFLPELDSMAVLELVVELERRFGIVVEGEDLTASAFETLGNLTELVERLGVQASS